MQVKAAWGGQPIIYDKLGARSAICSHFYFAWAIKCNISVHVLNFFNRFAFKYYKSLVGYTSYNSFSASPFLTMTIDKQYPSGSH